MEDPFVTNVLDKNIKPTPESKTIRVDDETMEKFRKLSKEEFGNQGQCLSSLLNLYEMEQSKYILADRKNEIESFQSYLNKIGDLFVTSLQLNNDTEQRVRSEFERLLTSKENTIQDLQSKVSELSTSLNFNYELVKQDKENIETLIVSNKELQENVEKTNKAHEESLRDKDNLNKALTDTCNESKKIIEQLRFDAQATEDKIKEFNDIKSENARLLSEVEHIKSEIVKQKEHYNLELDKALLEQDKKHQQELKETHIQYREEIKEYITRIDKLQEQHEKDKPKSRAEIKKKTQKK